MGIHGLMKLIGDYAPSAMKENDIKTYFGRWTYSYEVLRYFFMCNLMYASFQGRKVAIDASMCLYQFLIAVRTDGSQLTDIDGDPTRYH